MTVSTKPVGERGFRLHQLQRLVAIEQGCSASEEHRWDAVHRDQQQFDRLDPIHAETPGLERAGARLLEVALSVTNFFAVAEMIAAIDYVATVPRLICRWLVYDPRLRILPAPLERGNFPVGMAWRVRYRHEPAHRWLRSLVGQLIGEIAGTAGGSIE